MENWRDMKIVEREPLSSTEQEQLDFDEYFWTSVDEEHRPDNADKQESE